MPLWYVASNILSAAGNVDIVREHIETQLPLPYVHVISFMTKINLLVMCTTAGLTAGFARVNEMWFYMGVSIIQFTYSSLTAHSCRHGIYHAGHDAIRVSRHLGSSLETSQSFRLVQHKFSLCTHERIAKG